MLRCNVIITDSGVRTLLAKRLEIYASRTDHFATTCSSDPLDENHTECYVCASNRVADIIEPVDRPRRWLPVIAFGRASDLRNAYLAGCSDFMKDPWTPEELHFRALKCAPTRRHSFSFGQIELDESVLKLSVEDKHKEIEINQQQSAILKALLSLRGSVVSRELLYFAMWGRYGDDSRALDMQIHGLRNALSRVDESLGGSAVIRGVYGSGYLIA